MRSRNVICPNFLDTTDHRFAAFHNALGNVFRELRTEGVGAESKQTEAFSKEEESALWECGVLNTNDPKGLLVLFF